MSIPPGKQTDERTSENREIQGSQIDGLRLTAEEKRRQGKRNRAIGFAIVGLCLAFYLITVFKMGPSIMNRPM